MNKIAYLVLPLMFFQFACGGEGTVSRRSKHTGKQQLHVDVPGNGAKIVWIFPAGAGAARLSLGILEALEKAINKEFVDIVDMAGGVSSGALVAAALASKSHTATSLKTELGPMLRRVFATINALGDELIKEDFNIDELDALFKEMSNASKTALDFSTVASTNKSIADALQNAVKNIGTPKIAAKVKKLLDGSGNPKPNIVAIIKGLAGGAPVAQATAQRLGNEIDTELGAGLTVGDNKVAKVIAIASYNKNPVYFANPSLASSLGGPYAESGTSIRDALISTAAIPKIIEAPTNIRFYEADGSGGPSIKSPLEDGFFAVGGFDPSAKFYEIFSKVFSNSEIMFVYVGNGAPVDKKFRQDVFKMTVGGVSQKEVNNKKHIFVALDARLVDNNNRNLFDLAGFFDNKDLYDLMDKKAEDVTNLFAYKWLVNTLKAIR